MATRNLDTEKKQGGNGQNRPGPPGPDYKDEYVQIARVACENGATNNQLAKMFSCCRATIQNWMNK